MQVHMDTASTCAILVCQREHNGSCNIGIGIIYVAGNTAYIDGDTIHLLVILLGDTGERGQDNKGVITCATLNIHVMG